MIRLYTRNRQLEKLVRDAIAGRKLGELVVETPRYVDRPRAAHYVITKSALNRDIEWFAAQAGAFPVVLPEGMPWLLEKLGNNNACGIETKIIGADYRRMPANGE